MSRASLLREQHDDTPDADHIVVRHGVTWEDYEHVLEMRGDKSAPRTPVGSWTLKNKRKKRGAEADECYIFGTEPRERPQLAIEVEWTRGGIDKLQIYEKLGVDEVWIWRKGTIAVYVLSGGKFERVERSHVLPDFDLDLLTSVLDRDTLTQAVRDFRKALAAKS